MRSLLMGLWVAALCGPSFANDAAVTPSRAGTLRAVQGTVYLSSAGPGAVLRAARPGDAVDRSEEVLTTQDGAASIVLRDGTALVLGPSSRLALRDFQFDSTTQQGDLWLSLLRGSLRMVTGLIGMRQPSAVRLQARTVTVGIRGTDFIVQVPEE